MFKLSRQQKDHRYFCGNRYEKYSIKKLKIGAASVLIGAGFLFGYNVDTVEAASVAETTETAVKKDADTELNQAQGNTQAGTVSEPKADSAGTVELAEQPKTKEEKSVEPAKPVKEKEKEAEQASAVSEHTNTAEATELKTSVDLSLLQAKLADLEAQIERIRGNKKQVSQIQAAEKLVAEAKQYLGVLDATQSGADKKAKELSSLTSVLKSIKAEETPKENKNQDSRNGKKMEEGTGFRTGVTDQALTGSIHFDTSKGPTEKKIPVANNGDGERVINMAITYSASSSETVTDGKVRVTIPKAFIHSTKKPVFTNSSFVKSTDDRSTETDYVYDLNLNPMSGGSVAESLLKLYVGTSRTNAPSKDDSLTVKTEFISGDNVLSTKTATATFDYLSEIIYREKDTREKLVKNYLPQEQREYKLGSVVDGKLVPVSSPFRIPLIMTNDPFFNSGEGDGNNQNGNGRLTSYEYTISGIPEFLELDPTSPKNSKWTLENGVATLHPDQTRGIDQMLYYAGPVLRLKEGALSTPEQIAKVIESNGTKGYSAKIVYNAVGHRPDGSSFTQSLENPDGFRIYAGDGAPSIGNMEDRINAATNQRLFSNASNVDTFAAIYRVPFNKLKADGGTLPSQYLNYFIPKDQAGNYFTKFKLIEIATNELEKGNAGLKGYHAGYKDLQGQFKENFKLYGVNENNQPELIKEFNSVDETFDEVAINPEKKFTHLILKTPGIVDEVQDRKKASKTILGMRADLDVTVDTWKEKAKDATIQKYENKISQVLAADNTIESAIATERPNTGSSTPAVHTKQPTTLSLGMAQIGDRELTKDNLTRGKKVPIAVHYTATDYFKLAESEKNGIKVYDLDKLDSNINKTSVMLLADPKVPLKDFRLTADNRLLSKTALYFGGPNGEGAKGSYDQIKESYDTVNPTRIIENYKGTGKRAYIFESKDLGLSSYDLNRDGWIKGGYYYPAALTFEVENNGQIETGTYNIESYLVWNSDSETLFGNDRSLNANYVEGHEPGSTIAKSNINVTMNNVIEYSTSLTISKPGTTGTRGIIDVKNGQEVILTPRVENLTDTPQKIKEAVVLIPKKEAVTYLEGPIVENSDEYDVVYTTSTATDKTTGTYVTADQITNWKDVTAVKYVFKNDYTVTKEHGFTHNFNLRVDADNPNFVESTSQIFLKNNQNVWLESNIVGLRTEDVRGKLVVRYINRRKDDLLPKISERDFAGQPYTTTKEDVIPRGHWSGLPYLFKEIQADSVPETGTYERQVTKKVTYVYEEATFKEESKTITRTINYLEKNNESNVVANPVVQNITVKRKVYTGKETGRVVEGPWEYRTDAYQPNWPTTNSPRVANFEAPDREVIDRVLVSQDLINNGNVVENVYYERIMPIGGDVVAKYVIEGTTTELKQATDVAKGLKVGKNYTSTAPVAGEELTATDGKVYVYKGHKATSAAETGTVTSDKQEVVYEYAPKAGGNVEVKYVIAGTEENLKDPVTLVTNGQVGSDYTATKDATITKEDGRVYKLVVANNGLKTGSAGETGKVTTEKQTVTYEYELQNGDVTVNYTDTEGNAIEGKTSVVVENQSPTGKDYDTNTPDLKPTTITTPSGKVYKLVPDQTVGKENGKVTVDPIEVTYKYELQKGNVTVNYTDTEGNAIEGKTSVVVENQSPTGKDYDTNTPDLKPTKITTPSGKVYNLVPERTEGTESGKVTETPQNVTYVYELAKGNVTVSYKDTEGNKIEGYETPKDAEKAAPTGKDFNTATEALKPTKITTPSGKVYNLVPERTEGTESGKVTETPQNVTYVYELAKGDVTVSYKDTEGNKIPGYETPKTVETQSPTGKEYTTVTDALKPSKITTTDGKVYNLVPESTEGNESGKVTETPQNVTYVYKLAKGDVTVSYKDTEGNKIEGYETPKDAEKAAPTGKDFNTATTELKPAKITTASGKVYNLVPESTEGNETGKVTETPQNVTYVYKLAKGDVTVTYKDTEGNKIEGYETPKDAEKDASTGKDFNTATTELKPAKITTASGKVYNLVPERTEGTESGKVTENPQNVTYVYELAKGDVTVSYKDAEGNTIEGYETPKDAEKAAPTGKAFNTATEALKPTKITTPSGKVYNLVPERTEGTESGKVTETPQNVTYVYELAKGDVTVSYKDTEGNKIPGYETPKDAEKAAPTGKDFNTATDALKPSKITTASGKVYNLVPERTEGTESGKVTETPQNVTYVYELAKGDVTVKYENEAGESIKPDNHLKSQVPTGDDYNTTTVKDLTITKDGKLYKLVEKNGGVKEGSSVGNGKVTETPAVVTYVYSEVKGEIIQKFVNESGKEIKDPTNTGKKSLNEKVNLEHPNRITDKDGKVYEFVKVDKIPTNFTEQPQTATYTYRAVKGQGVTVSYETTTGVTLKETQTVQPKDTVVGTDYDTTTSNFKPERIEKDGKVYLLKEQTKAGSAEEKGKVSEQPQNVTYVYEEVKEPETKQKYGNVIVTYVDKSGRPLSGTTENGVKVDKSVIDTPASLVKTPYDTTDNKPQTITTAEGKVYKFVKVTKHSDAETSDVKGRTSVITYVYELQNTTEELPEAHIGFVVVNYVDVDGLPISGKSPEGKEIPTTVMDVNGDLVGTQYDTTDHKPTTITTVNGDVYEFVKRSETSDLESGELKEGVATVEYVYRKVITTYVDETGKEINPSDKGTKDKKDIPEYIHKETKKDDKGNTIHVYRQVVTTYVDETGKEINPSDKGTKDKKDIPEYTFKETKKDKDGNTIHVYTKKSSSTPYSPTPSTPSNEESKSTVWKDTEGNVLKPQEDGTKDKGTFTGYEYVKTILVGNVTTHIFKKVITPIHDETPSHSDVPGQSDKPNHPEVPGQSDKPNHPEVPGQSDIPTHSDVTATSDKSTQIETSNESTFVDGKRELPNTGTQSSTSSLLLGALAAMTGLGLVSRRRKDDKE